jgi:predicted Ser/Thr protein kinase
VTYGEVNFSKIITKDCEDVSDVQRRIKAEASIFFQNFDPPNINLYIDENSTEPFKVDDKIETVAKLVFEKHGLTSWNEYKSAHALIAKPVPVAVPGVAPGVFLATYHPAEAVSEKGNQIVEGAKDCPAPLTLADAGSPKGWAVTLKKDLKGKPTCRRLNGEVLRPMITILCKEFFDFSQNIESVELETEDTEFALRICDLMGDKYTNEDKRLKDFREEFKTYCGHYLNPLTVGDNCQTDGSMRHDQLPLYCTLEGKNERGKGNTDPYMKNIGYYWKSFEAKDLENLQYPCLSLELEGYLFCVSGMVNTDQEIVAAPIMNACVKLLKRPEIKEIHKIARLFKSIKLYLDHMRSNTSRPVASAFPFVKELTNKQGQIEQLEYTRALNCKVFVAKRNNTKTKVVLKFASMYNVEVHNFCHLKGFAPELSCYKKLDEDLFMVVMEHIDARPLSQDDKEDVSLCEQARKFLKEMHDMGYVHGDLRSPNVLVTNADKKLLIIDFDWAGMHNVNEYPLLINTVNIKWPDGVKPKVKLQMEHDEYWMKRHFNVMLE